MRFKRRTYKNPGEFLRDALVSGREHEAIEGSPPEGADIAGLPGKAHDGGDCGEPLPLLLLFPREGGIEERHQSR